MDYVVVWFILTGGSGYIEPQNVKPLDMSCGIDGPVVGVQVDRQVNPSFVTWPDPGIPGKHCRTSIAARVQQLAVGEYHIATTIMAKNTTFGQPIERYIGHDPHTTGTWRRAATDNQPFTPNPPGRARVARSLQ